VIELNRADAAAAGFRGGSSPKSSRVALPNYDRAALVPAVVHLGAGSFHRAHQAVYFDDLATLGETEWGVVSVGIRRRAVADALAAQNNMFTVVERGTTDDRVRIVGSVVDFVLLADEHDAVVARLADPQTRLVTLTITADGYSADESLTNSVFEPLVRALDERRRAGTGPFTVLSCDNLPDSGAAAQRTTLVTAEKAFGRDLAEWIEAKVMFPSSMVDRITPSTTDKDRDWVRQEFGIADLSPVVTEPFSQWIIEDRFCQGRPPLDRVGVRFVDDVGPYKLIKSRLLNGTHTALGYLGYLAGHRRADEAMTDPAISGYVEQLITDELAPLLPPAVPGMELDTYCATLLERLRNPAIGDPLSRLCGRGSTKMHDYLLPSLTTARAEGRPHHLLTLALAGWVRYLRGLDLAGEPIEVKDARYDDLAALAQPGPDYPQELLQRRDIFGDLAGDRRLAAEVARLIAALDNQGVQATIGDLSRTPLAS
jgi:mannitol 2-dehydrogenase